MQDDFENIEERIDFLLATLLDENELMTLRCRAACYLGRFDHKHSLKSLIKFATQPGGDEHLLFACGNSIVSVWDRNRNFDIHAVIAMVAQPASNGINNWLHRK